MKTKLIFLFLLVFCLISNAQEIIRNDLLEKNLKGKVKKLIETKYRAREINGQVEKDKFLNKTLYMFNEGGNLLKTGHFVGDNVSWEYIHIYDSNGNRIEETRYEPDGSISWQKTYAYNNSGKQTEMESLGPNGKLIFKFISTYDAQGNITKKDRYGRSGREGHSFKFIYDPKGKLTEEYYLKPNQRTDYRIVYKYDNQGNKTELYLYDAKEKLQEKQTFFYDEKGQLTENVIFDAPNFLPRKIIFSYNDKGDQNVRSRYTVEGQLLEKDTNEYRYNETGNLTSRKYHKFYQGAKDTYEDFQYANFDENGNWLKEIYFSNAKAQVISEREIEYFNN